MATEDSRRNRAQLLRDHEALIAERARDAAPDEIIVILDRHDELGQALVDRALRTQADLLRATVQREIIIFSMDRLSLAKLTHTRWMTLSERFLLTLQDGEVWVFAIANRGATLASFPRGVEGGAGVGVLLLLDPGDERSGGGGR